MDSRWVVAQRQGMPCLYVTTHAHALSLRRTISVE